MKNSHKSFLISIFVIYCAVLIMILFVRYGREFGFSIYSIKERLNENGNLVPFRTIRNYIAALKNGNISSVVVKYNLIGNFLLFMPMGFMLPELCKNRGFIITSARILSLIILVETVQLITGLGSLDIDDVILNLSGSLIGYTICYLKTKLINQNHQ